MKKIFKFTGISILVLFLFLLVAPFLFKTKIIKAIRSVANQHLLASVHFKDENVSISLLRSFPNLSIGLEEISIVGKDSFKGDTLIAAKKFRFTVDLMKAIRGEEIDMKRIYLQNPSIQILVLQSGNSNYNIVKSDTSKAKSDTSAAFHLSLKEVEIENGNFIYDDKSIGFYTELNNLNHKSKGDLTQDKFDLETTTKASSLTLASGGISWLYKIKTELDAIVKMDLKNMKFDFSTKKLLLNELDLITQGFVDVNEDNIDMNIDFKAAQNSFKNFLSIVPGIYQNQFQDLSATGMVDFHGWMKGKYTSSAMPTMDIVCNVKNGQFQYKGLPYEAKNIVLNLNYFNKDGNTDNTVLNVSKFAMNLAGEEIAGNLLLKTPISDPYIDAAVKGKIDLIKIRNFIPLDNSTILQGVVNADLKAKGNYSSVSSKQLQNFDANGKLDIQSFVWKSPAEPDKTEISSAQLLFSPSVMQVPVCKGNIGKSDFDIKGEIKNIFGYLFHNEVLDAKTKLISKYLNANSFMSGTDVEPKPQDTANISVIELPRNITANVETQIDKLIYDNYILEKLNGTARLEKGELELKNISANTLGGSVILNGKYDSKNAKNPFTQLNTKITGLDIGKSAATIGIFQKYAPISNYVNGLFNAGMDMSSILNERMQPNYNSMNVKGFVSVTDGFIKDLDVIKEIAAQLKIAKLQNLNLKNQVLKFEIKDGILKMLDSLTLPLGNGILLKLSGNSLLNQTINYAGYLKVPRELFGKANSVLDGYIKQASQKNWNLNVEKMIPIDIAIGGTFLKPKVALGLRGFKNTIVNSLKEQGEKIVKDEANKHIQEALQKAKEQADAIKKAAKEQADKVRAEGKLRANQVRDETKRRAEELRSEGEKQKNRANEEAQKQIDVLLSQAKDPIAKIAANKAAERIKKESAKKIDGIQQEYNSKIAKAEQEGNNTAQKAEEEANRTADRIEMEANQKAEKILKEAEEKATIK